MRVQEPIGEKALLVLIEEVAVVLEHGLYVGFVHDLAELDTAHFMSTTYFLRSLRQSVGGAASDANAHILICMARLHHSVAPFLIILFIYGVK